MKGCGFLDGGGRKSEWWDLVKIKGLRVERDRRKGRVYG